jgi:ABC-type polysaccharide/polyol phosphate transport system ATPase subunit
MSTVIKLRDISKAFTVHARSDATILSRMADLMPSDAKRHGKKYIQALSDISLDVEKGEVLGVIGKNASGKSTLLRIIAGIHTPDSGEREVHGVVTPIINLNVGLKHRLTIRDNIFLACSLYGMRHGNIQRTLSDIVEFAGIEEYIDMYPYQLSTGMSQRLSFSIAVHTKPEILLLDEIFSAGDLSFQERAKARMTELIRSHVTVVMVSHSLPNISRLCDKVVWMDKGTIREYGDAQDIVKSYREHSQKTALKV